MSSLVNADRRIIYSIKDLAEMTGYTTHVYIFILHHVDISAYDPTRDTSPESYPPSDILGTLHRGYHGTRLENVSPVNPASYSLSENLLIPRLSFAITSSAHITISDPNGTGKS